MKKKIIISILFMFIKSNCQDYINLDLLKENYKYKKYTLNTKELYGFNKSIEVYNFFVSPNQIILLSILPNLEGKENWKKIEDINSDSILSEKGMKDWLYNFRLNDKIFLYDRIFKKEGQNILVSYACIIEKFSIGSYPYPLVSDFGVINLSEKKTSIKKMYSFYNKFYTRFDKKEIFPLDIRNSEKFEINDYNHQYRYYFSKKFKVNGNKAYQFWLFDHWRVMDGYNYHRGIDRFIYIPNMGIVGGSYDFYFEFVPRTSSNNYSVISNEKLWDNIINEKIMIAEELK